MNAKDGLLIFKYSDCNKNDEKKLDKDLAKRFEHTHRVSVMVTLTNFA